MVTEVRVIAPAKVNFGLRVLSGTQNGFHSIEGVFQTIALADELLVRRIAGKNHCAVLCDEMSLPERNTISLSYRAFGDVLGRELPSVELRLTKRIPAGAGLGGGSSDAAAFIRALETLEGLSLSASELDEIAACVGSDVFFFLHCGKEGCALVSGRGEIVKPIHARRDLHVLLVFPGLESSTREAYAALDAWLDSGKTVACPRYAELESVYNSPVAAWIFANTFTPSVVSRFPKIGAALKDVRDAGALFSEMSGSGSTVYGVFASQVDAENASTLLAQRWKVCVTRPFGKT